MEAEKGLKEGDGSEASPALRAPEGMDEAFAKWWKTEPFTDEIRKIVKRGWDAGCAWTNLAIIERNPDFLAQNQD